VAAGYESPCSTTLVAFAELKEVLTGVMMVGAAAVISSRGARHSVVMAVNNRGLLAAFSCQAASNVDRVAGQQSRASFVVQHWQDHGMVKDGCLPGW
jgi:hypothetical protein